MRIQITNEGIENMSNGLCAGNSNAYVYIDLIPTYSAKTCAPAFSSNLKKKTDQLTSY